MDFDHIVVETFKSLAALAAEYEFRVRLLANKKRLPLTSKDKLNNVESAIIDYFKHNLSEKQKKCLNDGRLLRNKFLHGAFDAVIEIMKEKGKPVDTNSVRGFDTSSEIPIPVEEGMFLNFMKFVFGGGVEPLIEEFSEANKIVRRLNEAQD